MKIHELPDGLGGVVQFVTLDISENEFVSMPKSVYDQMMLDQEKIQPLS